MHLARSRYDVVMRHGDRSVPVVVDMLETRDQAQGGPHGALLRAKLERYDAPPGDWVTYQPLYVEGRWRWCLSFNDEPQVGVEWDRRFLHWLE
jgi:hypothetical protein